MREKESVTHLNTIQSHMHRPRIDLPATFTDKMIETINIIALIVFWILLLANYATLPEIIPVHYNAAGDADRFGKKIALFTLPIIATVISVVLGYLCKIPHTFNYIVPITPENAKKQYQIAISMLRYLKLGVTSIFFLIFYRTIQIANADESLVENYFLPLSLLMLFLPILYFYIRSVRSQ